MARLILAGRPFGADDVTLDGAIAFDAKHRINGAQSSIGGLFKSFADCGLIEWRGVTAKSRAPRRKGGLIRIWEPTQAGRRWASAYISPPLSR